MARKKNPYEGLYTLRPDGRYQGYYRDRDGKRHTVCDKDPEKLYYKIQAKENEQTDKPILFRDIAEAWHDATWEKVAEGTITSYKASYNRAVDRFGDWEPSDIMPRDILAHLSELRDKGLAKRTVKTQRTVYSLIFKAALIDERFEKAVQKNPASLTPLPDGLPPAKEREAPEDEIVKRIQENAQTAYFGLFAMFLICTGFRRGEALAVQWGDVDFKNKEIHCTKQVSHANGHTTVKKPKTESGIRTVPLLQPLEAILSRPEDAKDTDYIFHGPRPDKPMYLSQYYRAWRHYCFDMGLMRIDRVEKRKNSVGREYEWTKYSPILTAHNFRHGYITMLFEAGVDEYTAMKLAGHADIAITRAIYTHLRNKKKNESIQKLLETTKNGL